MNKTHENTRKLIEKHGGQAATARAIGANVRLVARWWAGDGLPSGKYWEALSGEVCRPSAVGEVERLRAEVARLTAENEDLRWAAMSDAEQEAVGENMRYEARMADEEARIVDEAARADQKAEEIAPT